MKASIEFLDFLELIALRTRAAGGTGCTEHGSQTSACTENCPTLYAAVLELVDQERKAREPEKAYVAALEAVAKLAREIYDHGESLDEHARLNHALDKLDEAQAQAKSPRAGQKESI